MPIEQIKKRLIEVFCKWGMPKSIRVDNGKPFGDPTRKHVAVLSLWLIGLGIEVIWNDPARPTQNPKVERIQQTSANWTEPNHCADQLELTQNLEKALIIQREKMPIRRLGNCTRLETFPQLKQNPRAYRSDRFDEQRIYNFLAKCTFSRKVATNGQVILYNQSYHVGKNYSGKQVIVGFDPFVLNWTFTDSNKQFVKSVAAKNFSRTAFWNLTVSQRTKKN